MDWNKTLVCYCTDPEGSAGFKASLPLKNFCLKEQSGEGELGKGFGPTQGGFGGLRCFTGGC